MLQWKGILKNILQKTSLDEFTSKQGDKTREVSVISSQFSPFIVSAEVDIYFSP
jgi:hypothetical protein